jgi:hypothetical protein
MQEWHGARDTVVKDKARAMLYQEPTKDGGLTFRRRRWAQLECNNGIRDRGTIRQIRLKKVTTGNGSRGRSRRQELCLGSVKTLHEDLG